MGTPQKSADVSIEELYRTVKKWPFFADFTEELLSQIVPELEPVHFEKGQVILQEGQLNSELYFLLRGQVQVLVNGEVVASLLNSGDILGEMSVITDRPVSATVKSKSDVDLVIFRYSRLRTMNTEAYEKIHLGIFRYFSKVLSQKLVVTNEKARRFEIANRDLQEAKKQLEEANRDLESRVQSRTQDLLQKTQELLDSQKQLEQQNAGLAASLRKLEEMKASRELTVSRLSHFYEDQLNPLRGTLNNLRGQVGTGAENDLESALRSANDAAETLKTMVDRHASEMAAGRIRILLVDPNKKQQMIARMALGGTGTELDVVGDIESAIQKIQTNKYDILFFVFELLELSEKAQAINPSLKQVLIVSQELNKSVPLLKSMPHIRYIVSRAEEDRNTTIKNINTTLGKLATQDLFGLDKYLSWSADIKEHRITDSECRPLLLEAMENYFGKLGVRKTIIERCHSVGEELLMNAIYDAPVDRAGKSLYNHLPRTVSLTLKTHEQGHFRYGCDGLIAAISVSDPFGALQRTTIYDYLLSCWEGRAGSLNTEKGGAGRGLHHLIETSDLVVFNVKKNSRTEVIALFNVDLAASKSVTSPAFHFFYDE